MTRPADTSPAPFAVGDRVLSRFHIGEVAIVRRVTSVVRYDRAESKWLVSTDGGEPCAACGKAFGRPIPPVDSSWHERAYAPQPPPAAPPPDLAPGLLHAADLLDGWRYGYADRESEWTRILVKALRQEAMAVEARTKG